MSVARTARRRRRQAANRYTHLPKQRRPKYSMVSAEKSQRRLSNMLDKQKKMQQRKKK